MDTILQTNCCQHRNCIDMIVLPNVLLELSSCDQQVKIHVWISCKSASCWCSDVKGIIVPHGTIAPLHGVIVILSIACRDDFIVLIPHQQDYEPGGGYYSYHTGVVGIVEIVVLWNHSPACTAKYRLSSLHATLSLTLTPCNVSV